MDPLALFRREAIEAREVSYLGRISIARHLSFSTIAAISVALGIALVTFAVYGTYTKKAKLPGILVPSEGNISLIAPQGGTITTVHVAEGEAIRAGQDIFTINLDRATDNGETYYLVALAMNQREQSLESELTLAKAQSAQRQHAYDVKIKSLEAEIIQAREDEQTLKRRIVLAETSVEKFQELAKSGYVPWIQAQQKQEELIDLQSRLISSQRSVASLLRDTDSTKAEKSDTQIASQEQIVQIERNLISLRQESIENKSRQTAVVRAAQSGIVGSILVHNGSAIQVNQVLGTVVPDDGHPIDRKKRHSTLTAELYAPSKSAGFIAPGQVVWLRYSAYNYQKFGMAKGVVSRVSSTPVSPQDLPTGQQQALVSAAQANEPMYKVSVTLEKQEVDAYGGVYGLKPGLALEADVIQDERRIWEWIFDPLRATLSPASFQNR